MCAFYVPRTLYITKYAVKVLRYNSNQPASKTLAVEEWEDRLIATTISPTRCLPGHVLTDHRVTLRQEEDSLLAACPRRAPYPHLPRPAGLRHNMKAATGLHRARLPCGRTRHARVRPVHRSRIVSDYSQDTLGKSDATGVVYPRDARFSLGHDHIEACGAHAHTCNNLETLKDGHSCSRSYKR